MNIFLVAAAAVPTLFLADRSLLWMERRGWIYWRKRESETGAASMISVINEIQTLLSPAQRHVAEEKERRLVLRDDEGVGATLDRRIDLESGRVAIRRPPPPSSADRHESR
ncbi:hypothetical protein P3T37_001729 [Kitasatospora sp. MAA4]|uniref:DUF6191 domain-containing protein n=1 Tax=Kitasatospora sp. MAA4 TaxID=3035093 RepID=UPI002473E516|nr:DUF6191 domain-containing protein [Kitasatospora sp. MAA4]MDH6132344.1 hypothetical protein [Kitasatospora sp. MAA4]